MSDAKLQQVPESINFCNEEENILELWKKLDAFQTCLRQSKGKPRYSFYDGPPFATGLPHYGHILAGTIKDIVTRFAHQSGFHVERRFGWDCHGLPIEYEIDKALGIKSPEDVAKLGIAKYNTECRKIVSRYAGEWEIIIGRLGRWIDFKNDYKTLYPSFMESVWWVFHELYSKGLVYKGVKVMPFSTACNTPLSNFESGQNYKEVVDPAVIVSFPLVEDAKVNLLAWTTTPWTLPSNLLLCVNPEKIYVKVEDKKTNNIYVLMKARLEALYKKEDQYTIIEEFEGIKLKGKKYKPLFPYFLEFEAKGAFKVECDGYVTEESGTGIVHQAPFFGEDDYRVSLEAGVLSKDDDLKCSVNESGIFVEPVRDFLGQYVKDADKNIIKYLKENGRLIDNSSVKHQYPYCWRSETPLIYKIVPSWFIRVEHMAQNLLECSQKTYWVPDFVKEKRFGNWLRDARDWTISRNRYWGTPIPLWISEDGLEIVCVKSMSELEQLSGQKITDLHRENIDHITIPSKRSGQPPLRRIPEVFDCWFESGSMPYAQAHYPFENKREFQESFPADFIAEGIDQTRGWFYTLLVIGTALFNKAPFKNLIANGLVLAEDGQKMSKRKKNYPDPMDVVKKYGADALRLYLINSPVVRAENLRFKEDGVKELLKDLFLPWYNAYRFLVQNIEITCMQNCQKFEYEEGSKAIVSNNIMDRWILSFTQSLLQFVKTEMAAYRLYTVVPRLVKFIDNLTNWYVRMNRKRLKGETGPVDSKYALHTLFTVLYSMVRIMAPFTPFITELMYQNLQRVVKSNNNKKISTESIHYLMLPEPQTNLIDVNIERSVSRMQTVIDLGRIVRDRKTIPIKYPLPGIVVIHQDETYLKDVVSLESYILAELNIRSLTVTTDMFKYGVTRRAEPDYKTLGTRLRGSFKAVTQAVKNFSDGDIQKFLDDGFVIVEGHRLESNDLHIMFNFTGSAAKELADRYEAHSENNVLILLDFKADKSLQDEGLAREIVNRVQKLRKKSQLLPSDIITVYHDVKQIDSELYSIARSHTEFIENSLKMPFKPASQIPKGSVVIAEEVQQLKGAELKIILVDSNVNGTRTNTEPNCRFVNVCMYDPSKKLFGTVLLENPRDENLLSYEDLLEEVRALFAMNKNFKIYLQDCTEVKAMDDLTVLHKKTLFVCADKHKNLLSDVSPRIQPFVRFENVQYLEKKSTILLENPQGCPTKDVDIVKKKIAKFCGVPDHKL